MTSDLVERAQRGDHEAFEALVRPAYERLYAIARRISRDPYAAEDAVQDAIVRAWRDLRGLRDPERFEAWLYRLLINACRDHARRVQRRPIEVSILEIDQPVVDHTTSLAQRDQLERAFSRLSVDQRPAGMAFGPDGALYFADHANNRVRRIGPLTMAETDGCSGRGERSSAEAAPGHGGSPPPRPMIRTPSPHESRNSSPIMSSRPG